MHAFCLTQVHIQSITKWHEKKRKYRIYSNKHLMRQTTGQIPPKMALRH